MVCSQCGKEFQVNTYPSINVTKDPSLRAPVRDGSLFISRCPYCGAANLLRYQTLYHDPEEKLMVWLLPEELPVPEGVASALENLDGYTLRRVSDVGSLVEKVNIHAAGLEDTAIEMCKHVTRMELAGKGGNPALADAPMKFYRIEGADHQIVLTFPLDGAMQAVNIGFNVYEDCRGIMARNPSMTPGAGFAVVDAGWVRKFFA